MLAWVLLSLALVILAKPIYDVQNPSFLALGKPQISVQPSGAYLAASHKRLVHFTSKSIATGPGSGAALTRRDDNRLVFLKLYGSIYPVNAASECIMAFFNAVAVESMIHWSSVHQPSALLTITQGQLQLTISCIGGTVP